MRPLPALISIFFLCFVCPTALADKGFSFVKNRVAVTVKPDDKTVSIPFEFENKSKRTLTISRYDSACSCISARVAKPQGKMTYKPGEKGEIVVDFKLGSFSGQQEKTLLLWTTEDPPDQPSSILTSAITIPVLFEITPKTLFWDQTANSSTPPEPKTITIKVKGKKPIRILNHSGTNQNFPYQLETIRDGWEYQMIITPKDITSPGMGMIKLTTDSPISRYKRQQAFVCVRQTPTN